MKKSTITIVFLAIVQFAYCQTINYTYDVVGNRTSRDHTLSANAGEDSSNLDQLSLAELNGLVDQTQETLMLNKTNKDSIKNQLLDINVSVYPNPAMEFLSIKKESTTMDEYYTIMLYDSEGRVLDKIITKDVLTTISINHLAKGLYYVSYVSKNDRMAWQIVKE